MPSDLVIRKVKYLNDIDCESYPLSDVLNPDCYGVYEVKGSPKLMYWVADFNTLADAEEYVRNN